VKNLTPSRAAFSLVELLAVTAIIALLAALLVPAADSVFAKAESTACAGNLRQIGAALNLYLGDHANTYPHIEPDPAQPIYPPETGAKSLLETFRPYGVTEQLLRCRADAKRPDANFFQKRGSSYEWKPLLDGELAANPLLYFHGGGFSVSPARVRVLIDTLPVHAGRQNALYGDGRVVQPR
jgi:prepilin-type N-terminal cleavage/methylation domain-containing protein